MMGNLGREENYVTMEGNSNIQQEPPETQTKHIFYENPKIDMGTINKVVEKNFNGGLDALAQAS